MKTLSANFYAVIVYIFLFVNATARAQLLQGTINGNVTDSSGAVVANARVTAVEQATHFERAGETNSMGAYTLPDLPPGTYTITGIVAKSGSGSDRVRRARNRL
jgi:hypothetical protein